MAETRKLAAILAADIAGYSRLAAADEERTLARLRALRSDLFDPTIALHHGRVVKRTGDGVLIEFRSVVDAVRCAIEVQNGMVERNAGLPSERRTQLRVGIHLGDVVEVSFGLRPRSQLHKSSFTIAGLPRSRGAISETNRPFLMTWTRWATRLTSSRSCSTSRIASRCVVDKSWRCSAI